MMDSYDLFSAMSGADIELIARSDYRAKRRKHNLFSALTFAACFAIILISLISLFLSSAPQSLQNPPVTVPSEIENTETPVLDPNRPLQLNGSDVGTLNLIALSQVEAEATMPDFLMYVNPERYNIAEGGGTYYILPVSRTENVPQCQMTISWQTDITLEKYAQQQISALSASMRSVSESPTDLLPGGLMIHGSDGSEWDSAQAEVYITSDEQGGIFIFTLNYYLQDTDGHAIWFRDMLQTFEIVTDSRATPTWMADLQTSVENFTAAFLKNDFSSVDGLIAENAEIWTYEADVHSETRILQMHYEVDNDAAPTSAHVSVRHKYIENDAYDYITMELTYTGGKWQVSFAAIER